jgi:hypothetical protein
MSRANKTVYHPHGDADDFKTVEGTLDSLDDRVTQNETDIATAQSDISDLESGSFTEASAADYRGDASGRKALTPETVWDAAGFVGLTDAASIAVDMSTGFNFQVTIAGNRTLANPSNAKPGQAGVFRVAASGATRTIDKGTNYFSSDAVSWPISIPSGSVVYIYYHVWGSATIIITGVIGPNFN